jgi:hypothetical protein
MLWANPKNASQKKKDRFHVVLDKLNASIEMKVAQSGYCRSIGIRGNDGNEVHHRNN